MLVGVGGGGGGVGQRDLNVGQRVWSIPLTEHDVVSEDDVILHPGWQGVDLVKRGHLGQVASSAGTNTCIYIYANTQNWQCLPSLTTAGTVHSDHKLAMHTLSDNKTGMWTWSDHKTGNAQLV